MSKYHPDWDITPILDAASLWRANALEKQGAVFGEAPVWTDENISSFNHYFVENPDDGEGNFMTKLERQLEPSSPGTKQLAAEMTWLMLLCPSNIGAENKRSTVFTIWNWSGLPHPEDSPLMSDEVLRGVGSAGTAFNTHRWREVAFFIHFMQAFRAESIESQKKLLADPWGFAKWMEKVPEADSRQLRHMILYLLFPENFERIFGRSDRRKLLKGFTDLNGPQIRKLSALEMSELIQKIRKEKQEELGSEEVDFYVTPLKELWKVEDSETPPADAPTSAFDEKTKVVSAEHVLGALKRIDKDAYPPDARSSTYDLMYKAKRYPPKYVLSLATEIATGEPFPRTFFSGGLESQCFKLLKKLGFHIERKDFVRELVKKFISQANEGADLVVSSYPREYRGLKVKVSFGQGNFAKIPWISFVGYGQTTSDGIYPVILYYKSIGVLIVTYGISETNTPKYNWKLGSQVQTIEAYLKDKYQMKPPRYGTSFVHSAYDLSDQINDQDIEAAVDAVIGAYHEQLSDTDTGQTPPEPPIETYGLDEALDGLFIEEGKFESILSLLKQKKNLILQGPPGVGKTFVCKRLAYALMGEKANDRLGMVQFHQSYSYEDFIQGYRPSGTGFKLKNGIFYEFCERAKDDPAGNYVFIIDELNRGNLSKVFGELMLLIEPDKRGPEWAIPLTYSEDGDDKFYIPENLYLIGLMNTADRSLAMVDYALRRRFAFAKLVPGFESDQFHDYMVEHGAAPEFIEELVGRLAVLNTEIAEDTTNLGPGFCVGHSFFCSLAEGVTPNWAWYRRVIETEIEPLLREYYFDDVKKASMLVENLLKQV